MKLYCFGESGHSYKAALALQLAEIDWTPIFVDFFNGETRSDQYRNQVNEMGEAPVLVDGDIKLTQSGVIQNYLYNRTGKHGGKDEAEKLEILLDDDGNEIIMPKDRQIPSDFYRKGDSIRGIIESVELKGTKPTIIMSRTSPKFWKNYLNKIYLRFSMV